MKKPAKPQLPKYDAKVRGKNLTEDGFELCFRRDKIGNVIVSQWKQHLGFRNDVELKHEEVEKLIKWLTKIQKYQKR